MGGRRRHAVLLACAAGALAITLLLGAAERGAAETTDPPACAGKKLCVTITDQAQASRSPAGSDHYMSDSFKVTNTGSSANLVNIVVTVTWADETPNASTTSEYRPAFSDQDPTCTPAGTRTLTCTAPKSLRPGEFVEYNPLVFRTATDDLPAAALAAATTVTVTASAKEQAKPSKGGAPPNDASVTVGNTTPYEDPSDLDISTAGGDITATLATAQAGKQHSTLHVPGADAPRGLFELSEEDFGEDVPCPDGLTCFDGGQRVTTVAPDLSPVNVQITYTGRLPSGTTENSLVVIHTLDDDTTQHIIDQACSGEFFSEPPEDEIYCRRVDITHLGGGIAQVVIDAWDTSNGSWTAG